MKQITITTKTDTRSLLFAFLAVAILLCRQMANTILRTLKYVHKWLNSQHDFGDKEDSIILTGWQYLGIGAISMVICFVLSIQW